MPVRNRIWRIGLVSGGRRKSSKDVSRDPYIMQNRVKVGFPGTLSCINPYGPSFAEIFATGPHAIPKIEAEARFSRRPEYYRPVSRTSNSGTRNIASADPI